MKKFAFILIALFLVGVGAAALFRYTAPVANGPAVAPSFAPSLEQSPAVSPQVASPKPTAESRPIVRYTDEAGFSPSAIRIRVGQTVTFINNSTQSFWPASDIHPTHRVYPGSGIEKCGTAEASQIFDACHSIPAGGEWQFTFNEVGTWRYHNHLRPSMVGVVEVLAQE